MDELIDACQSEYFHIGIDEVFVIASDKCPRCKGKDPAELFAKAINDLHGHLKERGQTMMLWGDRLLDAEETGYGIWEAAGNGTAPAIEKIPKDIIICDWHYEPREEYASLDIFPEAGFRMMPSVYSNSLGARLFTDAAREKKNPKILGPLCTNWGPSISFAQSALLDEKYLWLDPHGGKKRKEKRERSDRGFGTVMTVRETLSRAWNPESVE